MIGIYAEILAMDLTITERVRNLLAREPNAATARARWRTYGSCWPS
jgi:hypothetical protein